MGALGQVWERIRYIAGAPFFRPVLVTGWDCMLSSTNKKTAPTLSRDLGASHATAVVIGTIIGSGIFLVPAEMMQAVGSARMVYFVWIVGGLLSMAGAMTYAELGAMKPQAGGEYIYIRDAYGPLPAFLYAWTWFAIAKPASVATTTTGLVRILGTFSALAFLNRPAVAQPFTVSYGQLVAILAAALITGLNYIGVKKAGEFQLIFTLLKIAMIVAIAVLCFTAASGTWNNFATEFIGSTGGLAGFFAALVAALWAYDGWNDLNMVSGEVAHPERNIPLALIAGVSVVAILYMLTNAAVQYVLPAARIAASQRPASEATAIAVGLWGAGIVSAGMALSMLVSLNGTIMSGARVPYAMARDGYFFRALADVHPRFHTPSVALIVQLVLSIVLLLFAGNFRQLFSLAIFAEWLFYMVAASTVFVLRKKEPDLPRPYHTLGYPVVPALFVLAAAVLLCFTFTANPRNSAWGVVVILSGIPIFRYFSPAAGTSIWSFEGRIGRATFWGIWTSMMALGFAVGIIVGGIRAANGEGLAILLYLAWLVVAVWISLAMQVKRWHDMGRSGLMVLWNLTLIGGPITFFIMGCVRGTQGPNNYGSDPLIIRRSGQTSPKH